MFHTNYVEARRAFCETAENSHFELEAYELSNIRGVDGENLTIDVAAKGEGNQLIMTSGIHGVEGYAGSGCQIDCMKHADFDGVRVVLIHAVNPFGFSFKSRANENGVDLNRNCGGSFPRDYNREYDNIHASLWDHIAGDALSSLDEIKRSLRFLEVKYGEAEFSSIISGGQFRRPDGLFYGGDRPQESLSIINEILTSHCTRDASRMLTIDFHTGLGPSGHGELIFSGAMRQPAFGLAKRWLSGVTCPEEGGSVSAIIKGSFDNIFIRSEFGNQVSHVALEYGTVPIQDVLAALCWDAWLRRRISIDVETAVRIRSAVFAAFYGMTDEWRTAVITRAHEVVREAVRSLRD